VSFKRRLFAAPTTNEKLEEYGTSSSGYYLHPGRPGHRGGSGPSASSSELKAPRVVFLMGGGGSGKGAIQAKHARKYGIDRTINSDDIKGLMPLYSYKAGQTPVGTRSHPSDARNSNMYGPSGPRTMADYMQYSPKERSAMEFYIQQNTRFGSSQEFSDYLAKTYPHDVQNGNVFGGGLTHEVSSYQAKTELIGQINAGHSVIYDSTGSRDIADKYGPLALSKGMRVSIHALSTDAATAQKRNDGRARNVDPAILLRTHEKVALAKPYVRDWAQANAHLGVEFRDSVGDTKAQRNEARALGYTKYGPPIRHAKGA